MTPPYNFSKIRRVAVMPFEGDGGAAITNEFVRQLLASGLEVSDRIKGADAILSGRITEYKPGNKLMVFLGKTTTVTPAGPSVMVTNPIVSLSGSQVTTDRSIKEQRSSQIVSVNATLGAAVRLADAATGLAVWGDEYSYEALDIQDAARVVAASLVKSLRSVVQRTGTAPAPVSVQKGSR